MFLHIRVEDSSSSVLDLICQKQLKIRAAPVPQTPDRTRAILPLCQSWFMEKNMILAARRSLVNRARLSGLVSVRASV